MMLLNSLLTVAFLVVQLWHCNGEDIQHSFKVVSNTESDGFAYSLATTPQRRLFIGAPKGNYILAELGVKVRPPQADGFGYHLDVNEQFMMVSDENLAVYVFSSTHPYTLVARIPLDDFVADVKVLADNTLFVATSDCHVSVFGYTHRSSWDNQQKIVLEDCIRYNYISIAVFGDILAVGYKDGQSRRVMIYNKVNNRYTCATTLQPPEPVSDFGISVALEGQHLVVSSSKDYDNILFTYELDPSGGKWVMNGRLTARSPYRLSYVSLRNNILAATVHDQDDNPEVCAYVYKLSNNNNPDNKNSSKSSVSSKTEFTWKKVATLKTNGVPITYDQRHYDISVQDGLVFTGRFDSYGYGMVFVHEMNKH